jgi:hypothetical protein
MFGMDFTDNVVSSADSKAEPTRTRMHAEEWSAFTEPHKPTEIDMELYHAWSAIARQDYNGTLMCLQECTRQAPTSRLSTDVPFHLQELIQSTVTALTQSAEGLKVMALQVILHRREPWSLEVMNKVLMKYVCNTLRPQKLPSQKDVPLKARERTMNETSNDR